jgi:hypothetical protein
MKVGQLILSAIAVVALLFAPQKIIAQTIVETDVCVYGGTSAGVIAAYTVKKQGKNAILIEPGKYLGGMTTGGLGYTDIGNKYAITGLARDFYRRVGQHYGAFEQWIFEPKAATTILDGYVMRGGFPVYYDTRLKSVTKAGAKITEIVLENSVLPDASTDIVVRAKMFIDCTYEGDLMAKAGVSYIVGRESNSVYNETLNGFQLRNNHQFPDGIDPYIIPGQPSSGLVWGVSNGTVSPIGTGDSRTQAYNYRLCLTNIAANRVAITQPPNYDPAKYELLLRLLIAFPAKKALANYFIMSRMPNGKSDWNNKNGFSSDMIGMNYDYANGTYDQRKQIIRDHEEYTKGLLYFLGHDPRVPVQTRNEMLTYGYPLDEYVTNDNWSPQLYVREARRMIGNYVMTQANCKGQKVATDGVGLAAYTMDSHHVQRIVVNGMVKNEGCVEVGGFGPYPVAYNSLVPKPAECNNIYVPVCLSASHIAYGSIRMEPVFMVLAQSSAMAAVMAINGNTDVHNVNISQLQQKINTDPLADGSVFEILVDNPDPDVTVTGTWTTETSGGYGPNFRVNAGTNSNESVMFKPNLPHAGQWAAYVYFPKITGISTHTRINVFDGKITTTPRTINEADIRVTGQTSGEWVSLGTYDVPIGRNAFVEVLTEGADGKIVADAVVWIPIGPPVVPIPPDEPEEPPVPSDTLRDPENPPGTVNGLNYSYYEGVWSSLPDFSSITPAETGLIANVNLYPKNRDDDYAFRFYGYINIPADGVYTFYTTSDEGSQLFIGDSVVVNNDGLHTAVEKSGRMALNAGKHLFAVTFFERLGTASLSVRWGGPGIQKQIIPNAAYFRLAPGGGRLPATESEVVTDDALQAYPVPAQDEINVDVVLIEPAAVVLELVNAYGQIIRTKDYGTLSEGGYTLKLETGEVNSGLYYLRLRKGIQSATTKVIMQR